MAWNPDNGCAQGDQPPQKSPWHFPVGIGRRVCIKRLLVTWPYFPSPSLPLPPFILSSFPNKFLLLHLLYLGFFLPPFLPTHSLLPILSVKSVLLCFWIQVFFFYDRSSDDSTGDVSLGQIWGCEVYTEMISLLFSEESLAAARFVRNFPSQMHHLYTNNINLSTACLKNLLQTRHKYECVLYSIGFHTRKLNIQRRDKEKTF